MKNKKKNLEDIDFLTELTASEQEEINGGYVNDFVLTPPEPPPPTPVLAFTKWPGEDPRQKD